MTGTQVQLLIVVALIETFTSLTTVSRAHQNVGQVKAYVNVMTQQHLCGAKDDRNQEVSQLALRNKSSRRDAAGAIVDLLLAADSDEVNGKVDSTYEQSRQLVGLVDGLRNSVDNDSIARYRISFGATAAAATDRRDTRDRLERLARLVELSKYELEEKSRKSVLDSAAVVLTEIVDRMKRQGHLLDRRQQLAALRLNLFNQTSDE